MWDLSEYLLSSLDGGKWKLLDVKFIDFDVFVSVVIVDLFYDFLILGLLINFCRVDVIGRDFFGVNMFFLVKIKFEIFFGYNEEDVLLKKLRMENCEYGNDIESDE